MIYSRDTPFWSETLDFALGRSAWIPLTLSLSPSLTVCFTFFPFSLSLSLLSLFHLSLPPYCLIGVVVRVSTSRVEDPEFESRLRQDISGLSPTSDLKIGTPVATLPGAWHYRVSAWTDWPGVSILWLGEMESLICNFYLSVAAHTIV